ncbi:MAG: ACP S-malonyltransferase [Thermodesulfobacteriota bacterium]
MAAKKIAVLFPGQGSQYVGMAKEFLEADAEARELMAMAERVSGMPLGCLCLEGPIEELTRTLSLQPAMTVVNLICWQALGKAGVKADFFAGHSLGEYAALCAAGVLGTEETLALVTERGRLMEREAGANPGGMHAVVKLDIDTVRGIVAAAQAKGALTLANHNSAEQIVISGETAALDAAAELVKEKGGKAIPLKVSGAWHSDLIKGAVPDFEQALAKVDVKSPHTPLLFNVTAAAETDPARIRATMARQIAATVRWYEIVQHLLAAGVDTFIEVGPKTVLTGLMKKILPPESSHKTLQVDTPATLTQCLAEL